jgi:hypothetical protein
MRKGEEKEEKKEKDRKRRMAKKTHGRTQLAPPLVVTCAINFLQSEKNKQQREPIKTSWPNT